MRLLVRQRLTALLLPLLLPALGLVLAAVWLGYSMATTWAQQAQPWSAPGELLLAVLPAVLMLVILGGVMHGVARKTLLPWVKLAQTVQARSPKDFRQMELDPEAPVEVRAMVDALNRLFARAHLESDAQQRFIADAAHQLRTPLAALQSQVEAWALMVQAVPEKNMLITAEQVDQLRRASRRTTQLAHQLLVLSRVDSGLGQVDGKQRVDLKHLCETLLESFLDSALDKALDLGLEVETTHVTGHEWLLRELISNLLDNAIKYTPAGGQITLRCGRRWTPAQQLQAYVEVEDDGPGVDECEYTRLTQRFYRAPGAAAEGTGLGLAIAQEIAQGHCAQLQFSPGAHQRGLKVKLEFAAAQHH